MTLLNPKQQRAIRTLRAIATTGILVGIATQATVPLIYWLSLGAAMMYAAQEIAIWLFRDKANDSVAHILGAFEGEKGRFIKTVSTDFTSELSNQLWLVMDIGTAPPVLEVFASKTWSDTLVKGFEDTRMVVSLNDYLSMLASVVEEVNRIGDKDEQW